MRGSLGGGPFTRAQALAAGLGEAEIRLRLRRGTWVGLRRGVYVEASAVAEVADDPARQHALEVAGLLVALGRDAIAGGTSSARILGLESLTPLPARLVVVTTDRAAKGERRCDYLVRAAELPEHHRTTLHGAPITSAARTVVDVSREWSLPAGVVIIDSALRQRLVTPAALAGVLRDCHCWPGLDQARRAVELADPNAESVLESLSRVAMYEQGIPAPRTQVVIGDADGPFARVDFLWDEVNVIGEADGLGKYQPDRRRSTREIVRAEKRREERLADAGFEVVRWGWEDARNPPRLAHRLRAAFARGIERRQGRLAR